MTDFKEITDLLIKKGKVRGKPVGVSLFRDAVPESYEPIQDTPCSIIRFAMDEGKKVSDVRGRGCFLLRSCELCRTSVVREEVSLTLNPYTWSIHLID